MSALWLTAASNSEQGVGETCVVGEASLREWGTVSAGLGGPCHLYRVKVC